MVRRIEAVPRFATPRNPSRQTLGGKVAKVSAAMGTPFMPWQRDAADVIHEIDPDTGLYWYRNVIIIVMRQQGKTTFVRAKLTHRCITWPNQRVRYTAQTRLMARQRLEEDFYNPISESPIAGLLRHERSEKPGFRAQAGDEHIAFANGSRWRIDAVTKKSGHGPSLNEGVIDEAFAHPDARIEQAMRPAMVTIVGAQLTVASAAGDADSRYLKAKVDAGRAMFPHQNPKSRTCYIEFSAHEDADRADPATWWACMPALGITIDEATIHAELEGFAAEPEEFDRAYLGWWQGAKAPEMIIPQTCWDACQVPPDAAWTGTPVWSVDTSTDQTHSTIGMAGRAFAAGRVYVATPKHGIGTAWVVETLVKLRALWGGNDVAVAGDGTAAAMIPDLEKEGFVVHRLSTREKVDACVAFFNDALEANLSHTGDPELLAALASAVKLYRGENSWVWSRGKSLADITALYAATLARFLWIKLAPDLDYDPVAGIG